MQIYLTENLINGKKYIGKDSKANPKYLGSGLVIKYAIKKYGKKNFIKHILEDNIQDSKILLEREKYYINLYNAVKDINYYNITIGGDGGDTFTNNPNKELIRLKCSLNYRKPIYTPELRQKLSDAQKVKINKFDKLGNFICSYSSIEEGALDNKIKNKGNICIVAAGERNYAGGFRWSYILEPMPLLNNKVGRKLGTKNSYKIKRNHTNVKSFEILIFDTNEKLLHTAIGYTEAAKFTNLSGQMICKTICANKTEYKGYIFKRGKNISIVKYKNKKVTILI